MESILKSKSYKLSMEDTYALFWKEIFLKYWYLVVLLTGFVLTLIIKNLISDLFPINLITLVIFTFVFFLTRFRFKSGLNKNEAFELTRVMTLYDNRIEFEDNKGNEFCYFFPDIENTKIFAKNYAIRLNKKIILIPFIAFKSDEDRRIFEEFMNVNN